MLSALLAILKADREIKKREIIVKNPYKASLVFILALLSVSELGFPLAWSSSVFAFASVP
jgi:hypothetical protein